MIRHITNLRTSRPLSLAQVNEKQVVLPANPVPMGSLISKPHIIRILHHQLVKAALLRCRQLFIQFNDVYLAVAIGKVGFSIIKQKGTVVIKALHLVSFPGTFQISGTEQIGLSRIIGHKHDIEHSLVIAERCRPHSLSISILSLLQTFCLRKLQSLIDIGINLPVHQIIRTKNHTPRHKMHGGTHHIIGIIHPNHIRVGIIRRNQWIYPSFLFFHLTYPPL